MVAEDESMALVFHQVEAVAGTDYSVVIDGESGTGKEMLARVIHSLSNRSKAPFYAVNMASFSKTIFEDEYFGHAKGAYTDASSQRRGFFEAAQGGTLFLDEITELDPSLQAKLLTVIEEREFYRLGSTEIRNVDVRIIAATSRNLESLVSLGKFREDLYYRLNVIPILLPPLRDRGEDIEALIEYFLERFNKENSRASVLDTSAMQVFLNYGWPGNVRELRNLVERLAIMVDKDVIDVADIPDSYRPGGLTNPSYAASAPFMKLDNFKEARKAFEKEFIKVKLVQNENNITKTAKALKVGRSYLHKKIKSLN